MLNSAKRGGRILERAQPELRIVDPDLWERVQARLDAVRDSPGVKKARDRQFWTRRRPKHLLTGLAVCGGCGGPLASVGKAYLACGRARRQGTCDNRRSLPRPALEGVILDLLKERLMAPELVKEFAAFHKEVNRQRHAAELQVGAQRKALDEVTRKLDSLIEAIAGGLRSTGLQAKLDALEQRKAQLAATVSAAPAPLPRLHPNLAELYRQKVARLQEALAEPATRSEALELLRGLIERVIVRPAESGFEVELVGAIARMVEAGRSEGNKKAASLGEAAVCSVKVVAGRGFEPLTFRL